MKSFKEYITEGNKCEKLKKEMEKIKKQIAGINQQALEHGDPHATEEWSKMAKVKKENIEARKKEGCN